MVSITQHKPGQILCRWENSIADRQVSWCMMVGLTFCSDRPVHARLRRSMADPHIMLSGSRSLDLLPICTAGTEPGGPYECAVSVLYDTYLIFKFRSIGRVLDLLMN